VPSLTPTRCTYRALQRGSTEANPLHLTKHERHPPRPNAKPWTTIYNIFPLAAARALRGTFFGPGEENNKDLAALLVWPCSTRAMAVGMNNKAGMVQIGPDQQDEGRTGAGRDRCRYPLPGNTRRQLYEDDDPAPWSPPLAAKIARFWPGVRPAPSDAHPASRKSPVELSRLRSARGASVAAPFLAKEGGYYRSTGLDGGSLVFSRAIRRQINREWGWSAGDRRRWGGALTTSNP